jgi:UDP-N-acetylglucosamine 1-carboxyvinyltransferase
MAAVHAEGTTVVENAAMEPEIVDLARFLASLGARIEGAGTPRIVVQGVTSLTPSTRPYPILPDRIETGTYLMAGAITGGDVTVEGVRPGDVASVLDVLRQAGCGVEAGPDTVRVWRDGPVQPVQVTTEPFPGFPTDMQAQLMALMTLADGTATIRETIFENRFLHAAELMRLGARIECTGNLASIHGVPSLRGATVMATDLRASASLVLGGLAARGSTEVLRLYHLDRGYERLDSKLRGLGAQVTRAQEGRPAVLPVAI